MFGFFHSDRNDHAIRTTSMSIWTMALVICFSMSAIGASQAQELDIRRKNLDELTESEKLRLQDSVNAYESAMVHFRKKEYRTAIGEMERCLKVAVEIFGKDYSGIAGKYTDMGVMSEAATDFELAVKCHAEALRINRIGLPEGHPLIAVNRRNLGLALVHAGKPRQGQQFLDLACQSAAQAFGEASSEFSLFLNDRGLASSSCRDFRRSAADFSRSLQIKRKLGTVAPKAMAITLSNLGESQIHLGDYIAARKNLDEALSIVESQSERDLGFQSTVLNNLGYLNRRQGEYETALNYYLQALEIRKKIFPANHPEIGRSYANLAPVQWQLQNLDGSIDSLLQAKKILETTLGNQHPDFSNVLEQIAENYYDMQRYEEAMSVLMSSFSIRAKTYGLQSLYAAKSLLGIGGCAFKIGKTEQALQTYLTALPSLEKALGSDHFELILAHDRIGLASLIQGNHSIALDSFDHTQRIVRKHALQVLPGLPTAEQARFRQLLDRNSQRGMSLVYDDRLHVDTPDTESIIKTASWVINNKALLNEAQSLQVQNQLLEKKDSSEAKQLLDVRKELASRMLSLPATGFEQDAQSRIQELLQLEAKLSRVLSNQSTLRDSSREWTNLGEVLSRLPADGAFVDILKVVPTRFDPSQRKTQPLPARYGAWIYSKTLEGDVRFIDLGEADAIDRQIQTTRQLLEDDGRRLAGRALKDREESHFDMVTLTEGLNAELGKLSDLLYKPLQTHIGTKKHWTISPDGNLWLVPWAALPVGQGQGCLIEQCSLKFVTTSRDLFDSSRFDPSNTQPPVIIANPDFDQESTRPQPRSENLGPRPVQSSSNHQLRTGHFAPIPHTGAEANRILPSLHKLAGLEPILLKGDRALEETVKSIVRPSILVFSTHGFFLDAEPTSEPEDSIPGLRSSAGGLPSMLGNHGPQWNCGLALTGCNRPEASKIEDGILTGGEVLGMDLRGTRLVVLSACDTGIGEVQNGEGVAGLRQAFLHAGAEGVVATLWKTLDKESATTTDLFFENLSNGETAEDALRTAQLQRISDLRELYLAAHPYLWASMTYTGR